MTFWGHFHRWQNTFSAPPLRPPLSASKHFVTHGTACGGHTVSTRLAFSRDCFPKQCCLLLGFPPSGPGTSRCPPSPLSVILSHPGTMGRAVRSCIGLRQNIRKLCLFPPCFSPTLPSPASLSQVYVSYDYGKSFQKISEKLNFGVGNSSEAVIAQFYHSPADNRRVRWRCGWGLMGILPGEDCTWRLGAGRFVIFAA